MTADTQNPPAVPAPVPLDVVLWNNQQYQD
jgi:hypothetical protein